MRLTLSILAIVFLAPAHAEEPTTPKSPARGAKSVTVTFEPSEAKPGQTVTLKLTVELEKGYHTYPLVQPDKQAEGMVNKLEFPQSGSVIFVGPTFDPAKPTIKAEPLLGITEMYTYYGTLTYERRAVISPKAKPGDLTVALPKFLLSICDDDNCFPPKVLKPEAKLKILEGSEPVAESYREEVEQFLKGK